MYKARFAQWGLQKYMTARDLPELLHRTANRDDTAALVIRGRRIPSKTVRRYLKRNATIALPDNEQVTTVSYGEALAPATSSPRLMSLPTDLRFSYDVVQLSRHFIAGCADGGTNPRSPVHVYPSQAATVWLTDTFAAGTLIKQRRFKEAFKHLDVAFGRIKELLRNAEPTIFIFLYYILFQLPADIGQRLCTYVAEVSALLLPINHPMTIIWSRLSQTDNRQRLDYGWLILHSYFQSLKQQFRCDKSPILRFSSLFYLLAYKRQLIDLNTIEAVLNDVVAGLKCLEETTQDVLRTRLALGEVLLGNAKYEAVEKIINETEVEIRQKGTNPEVLLHYYWLSFDMHRSQGKREGTIELGRNLLRFLARLQGFTSGTTLNGIRYIQSYWAKVGRLEEANELLVIFNAGDELEQKLRAYIRDIETGDGDDTRCEILDSGS
jgi:hypothetical protein